MEFKVSVKQLIEMEYPFYFKVQSYYTYWKVYGEKKNFWGNWVSYCTNLYVRDAKMSLMAPVKNTYQPDPYNDSYTLTFWDSPETNVDYDDTESCMRYYIAGYEIKTLINSSGLPKPNFERIDGVAWSRGVSYENRVHATCGSW